MRITKTQLKRIIKEEYAKIQKSRLRESFLNNQDLQDLAEEQGIYYKDFYDVPAICESALEAGLMTLEDVDRAAADLQAEGVNTPEDALMLGARAYAMVRRIPSLTIINSAVKEHRGGRWPMNPNPRFYKSSFVPMILWIVTR
tara:strand:- start:576 stop:1004 length:429 start_codon:yes stop_codon:yes gene_type:complete